MRAGASTLLRAAALMLATVCAHAANFEGDALRLCDRVHEPAASLKPSSVMLELSPHLAKGDFAAAYATLADILETSLGPAERTMPGVERFLGNLRNGHNVTYQRFSVSPFRPEGVEKLFQSHLTDEMVIPCRGSMPRYFVQVVAASLVAWRVGARQAEPELAARALGVMQSSRDAESLLRDGLAMWPWELWLNGLRVSRKDSDSLFRTQLIFMRPTAGIEVDTRNRASADLQASVMVEPLGFVRYRGDGYSHWWGASFVVTSSTGRGAGIGGLLRWDSYVFGITRHKGDGGAPDSNFLVIGVEVYDFLKKRADPKEWDEFRARRTQELRDKLGL
jgi:hypothetical protein